MSSNNYDFAIVGRSTIQGVDTSLGKRQSPLSGHCINRQMLAADDSHPQRRKQLRLQGYDYALPGACFVTLCTNQSEYLFREIVDGEMKLNAPGEVAKDE
ncbi:MAG: hypothetical protein MUO76_21880 [Anaerolineaceae bacterium]|nr:hypothetical protein [Anaerolineaceae bacterium]